MTFSSRHLRAGNYCSEEGVEVYRKNFERQFTVISPGPENSKKRQTSDNPEQYPVQILSFDNDPLRNVKAISYSFLNEKKA